MQYIYITTMCLGFSPLTSNVGTFLKNKDILAAPQNLVGLFDP